MTIIINEAASEDAKLKTLPNFHCTMNMINNTNSQILCMVDRRRRRRWMVVLVEKSVPPLEIKRILYWMSVLCSGRGQREKIRECERDESCMYVLVACSFVMVNGSRKK